MQRKTALDFDQRVLDLYDDYAHGRISRRDFSQRVSAFLATGLTAESILTSLAPNYAFAQQVPDDDSRIYSETFRYVSERGGGAISGLLTRPTQLTAKIPAVLVIHENRGLNPYIRDVARRLAVEGFLALAPDALSPLGGYPGNDDEGRVLQSKRPSGEMVEDFIAAAETLKTHPSSNGKVGVVGFCFGGGMANELAVRIPEVIDAAVPFYGRQPAVSDVPKIKASLLLHYAELDSRINEGWPEYEIALKAAQVNYEAFTYPGVNHGFHNDTTPRFDEAAARIAWQRTISFFKKHLI
ncbi:MAG: dienelactone hydrolase family protein [Planctomycetota bacterium]|nr:dienelactone hydrolase family protein [Planctomycetota bacterium]MDA1179302.1 dienelactone hydrolase family protein [Planctomycetota bacterium]